MKEQRQTILNFLRNIKGRFDLFCVLFRWDSAYRKEFTITILAFLLITYSFIDMDSAMDYIALGLEVAILMMQFGSELSILPPDYRPGYAGSTYLAQTCTHVWNNKRSFPMGAVNPAPIEAELGFHNPIAGENLSMEFPLVSDTVDDKIMLRETMPYEESSGDVNYIRSNLQILYLALRVANKKQHTTNGEKLALYGLTDCIVNDEKIPVRKSYYFDALLTNEAFRSRLIRKNLRGHEEIYSDLSAYYPAKQDTIGDETILRLLPDFYEHVSGHIGITTLLITDNNRIGMLHQGAGKVIDAKKVGLGGSGSMDYHDVIDGNNPEDLRDALKYGMTRELSEETGTKSYFDELRDNTMVIGFFRWVDRCAKPEFLGVTRGGNVPFSEEGSIDGDEIVKFEEMPVDIHSLQDFKQALVYVKENGLRVSLSSLMALVRLARIADYNKKGASKEQKEIYQRLDDFLFPKS